MDRKLMVSTAVGCADLLDLEHQVRFIDEHTDYFHLDIKDGYLTVSAEKGLDKDEEDKSGRLLRQERYAGACSRSFFVGEVKPEDVKAKYESGVLTVIVPKEDVKKTPTASKIAIE